MLVTKMVGNEGGGIRGDIIVLARRLDLKHDATEVELQGVY